jgi:hypothetical protein
VAWSSPEPVPRDRSIQDRISQSRTDRDQPSAPTVTGWPASLPDLVSFTVLGGHLSCLSRDRPRRAVLRCRSCRRGQTDAGWMVLAAGRGFGAPESTKRGAGQGQGAWARKAICGPAPRGTQTPSPGHEWPGRRRSAAWSGTPDRSSLAEVPGRRIRHRMHRVIHPLIGPQRGDGDHAIVGPAIPAQPLPAHVRGPRTVLAVPLSSITSTPPPCGAVAGSARSNSSRRPLTRSGSHRDSERKNCSRCTAGWPAPVTGSAWPARQRLVPVPRRQQPHQVLPELPPLRQRMKQMIKPGRITLQRPRRLRT